MITKIKKQIVSGILALSLFATSFGGAVSVTYAATPNNAVTNDQVVEKTDSNGLVAGLVAVGLLAILTNHGGSSDKDSGSGKATSPGSSSGTSSASEAQQALTLLNQDRAAKGLPALKWNSQLASLATSYGKDMISRGYFSHYNPEGQSPFDRMNKAGISYRTAGENLAINTSVAAAEKAFMNSSGHRANILSSNFTEVGIGVVHSSSGSVYVVQEFIGK